MFGSWDVASIRLACGRTTLSFRTSVWPETGTSNVGTVVVVVDVTRGTEVLVEVEEELVEVVVGWLVDVLELEGVEELVLDEEVEVVGGFEVLVDVEEELVEVVVG
jgi:hypothetical protein